MKLSDLKSMSKDDVLCMMGLQARRSTTSALLGALGPFGLGLVVGAGVALLLAPKPGSEIRQDVRERLGRAPEDFRRAMGSVSQAAGTSAEKAANAAASTLHRY